MTQNTAVVPESGTTLGPTEDTILRIVREVMGNHGLGAQDDLFDHGATSLSFVRVLAQIKQELQVMVHAPDLDGVVTARSLATNVHHRREV
jgi:hypothetical protein